MGRFFIFLAIVLLCCFSASQAAPVGRWFDRVFIILMENSDPSQVLANSYFKSLAKEGTLLTNVAAAGRPSQPNYIALLAGSTLGCTSDSNINLTSTSLVDKFETHGISWKAYMESTFLSIFLP